MGHDRGDAAHRSPPALHIGLQRQHRGARPDLPILLDDVDLLEVQTSIPGRVEVLLPIRDAAPKAATPRHVSASMSPSRYLRSSIILRLSRVRPDSTGRAGQGSPRRFCSPPSPWVYGARWILPSTGTTRRILSRS